MGYNVENSTSFLMILKVVVFLLMSVIGMVIVSALLKLVGIIS